MGRGLGTFQREILQRIGLHLSTFGESRVGEIAIDMAVARGVVTEVTDTYGNRRRIDVANLIGLRRALATLDRRRLVIRYQSGRLELTEAGEAVAGDCPPMTAPEVGAGAMLAAEAMRRRKTAAVAAGRLKPNGEQWD
jgi:hypothetical protein